MTGYFADCATSIRQQVVAQTQLTLVIFDGSDQLRGRLGMEDQPHRVRGRRRINLRRARASTLRQESPLTALVSSSAMRRAISSSQALATSAASSGSAPPRLSM